MIPLSIANNTILYIKNNKAIGNINNKIIWVLIFEKRLFIIL